MAESALTISIVILSLLLLMVIVVKCNKCANDMDRTTTLVIDNVHTFGRDTICKTAPSTPRIDPDIIEKGNIF